MITARAILGHVRWAAVGAWGGKLMSLVVFVVLTRLLPVDAIGAISLIAVYLALLQLVAEAGLAEYLVQHQVREELQEQSLFWTQLACASLVTLGLWLAAPLVAASMPESVPGEALVQIMSLSLPLVAAARVPDALMRKSLAFKQLAYRNLAAAVCGGVVGVVCALRGFGVWSLVAKQLVENSIALAAVMLGARWRPRLMFSRRALVAPLRYGLAVFGARAVTVFHSRIDSLVVGWLLGVTALGYYSIALRAYQIVSEMFNSVVDSVSVPLMARVKHDPAQLKSVFLRLVRGSSLLSMTAYALLAALAPLVVAVAFGPKWALSGELLRVFGLLGIVIGPFWFNGGVLFATGRPMQWMIIVSVYALVGAIVFPIAALTGGVLAVAGAMVVRSIALAPYSCSKALPAAGVSAGDFVRAWLPNLAICIGVGSFAWLGSMAAAGLRASPIVELAAGAIAGGVAFLAIVAFGAPRIWRQMQDLLLRRVPASTALKRTCAESD